jgi:alpha-amylase
MKRIHLFLVGILFLLCLVPLSQACSDDSPEIPVPPTPENPDPPTATWKNITAAPDNWDGSKRADISYQLLVYSFADKDGDKCTGEGRPWKLLFKTRRICLRCLSSKKLIYENT